jgi:RimJ/RimL family protein N-acetyltransferase
MDTHVVEPRPVVLEGRGMRLEPLKHEHHDALAAAAADGKLWQPWFTSVPEPGQTRAYIEVALAGLEAGHMLPWAVRELGSGEVIGTTRYHDIVAAIDRVETGWTWYAAQRSHMNTSSKLLLLEHAFDVLGCKVLGLRTDNFNFASHRAIEGLGAKRDGVLRHHQARGDGTVGPIANFPDCTVLSCRVTSAAICHT